mmetsp:Transcript_9642/g.16679  ORF Transcript_9642/g.16679 Transcript_9642/m.16679 type:complete len:204 (-) Transcript_9642:380-991(-)
MGVWLGRYVRVRAQQKYKTLGIKKTSEIVGDKSRARRGKQHHKGYAWGERRRWSAYDALTSVHVPMLPCNYVLVAELAIEFLDCGLVAVYVCFQRGCNFVQLIVVLLHFCVHLFLYRQLRLEVAYAALRQLLAQLLVLLLQRAAFRHEHAAGFGLLVELGRVELLLYLAHFIVRVLHLILHALKFSIYCWIENKQTEVLLLWR